MLMALLGCSLVLALDPALVPRVGAHLHVTLAPNLPDASKARERLPPFYAIVGCRDHIQFDCTADSRSRQCLMAIIP
jgi:hypothetical protein